MRTLKAIRMSGICLWIASASLVPFTHFILHKTTLDSFGGPFALAAISFAAMSGGVHRRIKTLAHD